jgi:glycosyltransferase involved in cell wall biosynthesis
LKKTIFFTKYSRKGASSRLRTFQFLDFVGDSNDYDIQYLLGDEYLANRYQGNKTSILYVFTRYLKRLAFIIFNIRRYDSIYIEKELFPYMPSIVESFLKGKYVVDYDDAIFHLYDMNRNFLIRFLFSNKVKKIMRNSSLVIAGNEYLKKYAQHAGAKNIVCRPTVVSIEKYSNFNTHISCEEPIVGWIGTPLTQKYLEELIPALDRLAMKIKFKLHIIGGNTGEFEAKNFEIVYIPWSEETEVEELNKVDVGIMPIPNFSFEKGKCGYKLVQYMALGRPVVGSPVGVNTQIIEDGKNGYIANSPGEWEFKLEELLTNKNLQTQMGSNGRDMFLKKFSLESYKDHFFSHL